MKTPANFLTALVALLLAAATGSAGAAAPPPDPAAAARSAAGKRIVASPKTQAAFGFAPYPGAMLDLNASIEESFDPKSGDRTNFVYRTPDPIAKVREFYGMPANAAKLENPEALRMLQLTGAGAGSGTVIVFRSYTPKPVPAPRSGRK